MKPYVTFIGCARNDDYVPDRSKKHNTSINFLIQQLKEYEIPSEILIVEWNYPEDRPPLAETIKIWDETPWTKVRVIRVPASYHQRYKYWDQKPFQLSTAVNVGIRRSLGKFVMNFPSDVFLTDACLKVIAKQNLDENSFYRCDRYDVDVALDNQIQFNRAAFLKECSENVKTHHSKIKQSPTYKIADLHTNASGDFLLVSKKKFEEIRGFKEEKIASYMDLDSIAVHAFDGLGLKEIILPDACRVYKISHQNLTIKSVEQVWKPWQKTLEKWARWKITNDLRILFNYPKRRYKYAPDMMVDSFEKNFVKPARRWAKKIPPFYLNDENWGLKNIDLDETELNLLPSSIESMR